MRSSSRPATSTTHGRAHPSATLTAVRVLDFRSTTTSSGTSLSPSFRYTVPRTNGASGEYLKSPGVDSPSLVRGVDSPPSTGSRPSRASAQIPGAPGAAPGGISYRSTRNAFPSGDRSTIETFPGSFNRFSAPAGGWNDQFTKSAVRSTGGSAGPSPRLRSRHREAGAVHHPVRAPERLAGRDVTDRDFLVPCPVPDVDPVPLLAVGGPDAVPVPRRRSGPSRPDRAGSCPACPRTTCRAAWYPSCRG